VLSLEALEDRRVLAAPFQNPAVATDVDNSGATELFDLLSVVGYLRDHGAPAPLPAGLSRPPFYNVDGDNLVGINDLLGIVQPLRSGAGQPEPFVEVQMANDTGAPGDGVTADARISGQITSGLTDGTVLVAQVRAGEWRRVAFDYDGAFAFDPGFETNGLDDDPHSFRFIAQNYGGPFNETALAFTLETPGATVLREGDAFVAEATIPIALGQSEGARTLRFDVHSRFDESDSAALEDLLLVYLADPADPQTTLLDRGENGTSLFSLAGDEAEFPAGRVRWDGSTVEIDLTRWPTSRKASCACNCSTTAPTKGRASPSRPSRTNSIPRAARARP
jgi:hypothetical protein